MKKSRIRALPCSPLTLPGAPAPLQAATLGLTALSPQAPAVAGPAEQAGHTCLSPGRSIRTWSFSGAASGMTSRSTSSGRPACCRTTRSWRRRTSACRSRCLCSGRTRQVSGRVSSGLQFSHPLILPFCIVGRPHTNAHRKCGAGSGPPPPL